MGGVSRRRCVRVAFAERKFRNTALEEVRKYRTPVVITENCGAAPLLAGVAGLVVGHETAAMARAVKRILSDAELCARFSEGGKQAASRLGWEQPVSAMEKLYAELAARHQVVGQCGQS
jgi:glycosyltransferase involved in cell wall biosynthesis